MNNLPILHGLFILSRAVFKGTVSREFSLPVFLIVKLLLLAPINMPGNDLNFFRIFVELFDNFCASLVSLILAKQEITGVIDSGEKFLTNVNCTGECLSCCFRVFDQCQLHVRYAARTGQNGHEHSVSARLDAVFIEL